MKPTGTFACAIERARAVVLYLAPGHCGAMRLKDVQLHTRVIVARAKVGFVRFVGPVKFAAGDWIGVELDKPGIGGFARWLVAQFGFVDGKHNGTVEGISYFNCSANHGIFVKASAVEPYQDAVRFACL